MIINIEVKTRGSTVSHPQEKKSNLLTRQGKVLFLVVEISDSGLLDRYRLLGISLG